MTGMKRFMMRCGRIELPFELQLMLLRQNLSTEPK